jgi:phosphatidylserine/phosphatidylglycerophosphate/cardiolipin synthase-like enzyme
VTILDNWFLDENETPQLPNRIITPNQVLGERFNGWRQNFLQMPAHLQEKWTSGNEVTALVDGSAYMGDLDSEIVAARADAGDAFILIAGWQFKEGQRLTPQSLPLATRLTNFITSRTPKRSRNVRLLAFDNPLPKFEGFEHQALVAALNNASAGSAYCDPQLGGTGLSHHEKLVFIYRSESNPVAYIGGIDLAADRFDTTNHSKAQKENTFFAWHDIMLKVRGRATAQIWANFAERWEERRTHKPALLPCPLPDWQKWPATPLAQQNRTCSVQLLRTIATTATTDPRQGLGHRQYGVPRFS